MCKERHKYAECKPFNTPSKPAEQQDQTEIVNQDETQIISRVKICCLDTREEYVLNPGKNIIGRVANPPQAEILFKDESRYMGRRHAEINVINQGAQSQPPHQRPVIKERNLCQRRQNQRRLGH
jgi:hypothetical protein